MSNNTLHSLYPGDPRQYDPIIRPAFEAAKRSYPIAIHSLTSTWILEPNAFNGQMLMLAEYPNDNSSEPIRHWMFQCRMDELCIWCHDGYGTGVCRWHSILAYSAAWLCWNKYQIERLSNALNASIDRHIVVKLALLSAVALLVGWMLIVLVCLPGHIDNTTTTYGMIALAIFYLAHVALAIRTWKQTRMSEQADNSTGKGDN